LRGRNYLKEKMGIKSNKRKVGFVRKQGEGCLKERPTQSDSAEGWYLHLVRGSPTSLKEKAGEAEMNIYRRAELDVHGRGLNRQERVQRKGVTLL